jgi:hypothetical protein
MGVFHFLSSFILLIFTDLPTNFEIRTEKRSKDSSDYSQYISKTSMLRKYALRNYTHGFGDYSRTQEERREQQQRKALPK